MARWCTASTGRCCTTRRHTRARSGRRTSRASSTSGIRFSATTLARVGERPPADAAGWIARGRSASPRRGAPARACISAFSRRAISDRGCASTASRRRWRQSGAITISPSSASRCHRKRCMGNAWKWPSRTRCLGHCCSATRRCGEAPRLPGTYRTTFLPGALGDSATPHRTRAETGSHRALAAARIVYADPWRIPGGHHILRTERVCADAQLCGDGVEPAQYAALRCGARVARVYPLPVQTVGGGALYIRAEQTAEKADYVAAPLV